MASPDFHAVYRLSSAIVTRRHYKGDLNLFSIGGVHSIQDEVAKNHTASAMTGFVPDDQPHMLCGNWLMHSR
jgi:hypothetical protein